MFPYLFYGFAFYGFSIFLVRSFKKLKRVYKRIKFFLKTIKKPISTEYFKEVRIKE